MIPNGRWHIVAKHAILSLYEIHAHLNPFDVSEKRKKMLYADGCSAEKLCSLIYWPKAVLFINILNSIRVWGFFLFKFYYPPSVRKCTRWSGVSLLVHRTKATFSTLAKIYKRQQKAKQV